MKSLTKVLNPARWFSSPEKKSWFSFSAGENYRTDPQWFQKGFPMPGGDTPLEVSTVYSCISIIAQEMARLNIDHWIEKSTGGKEKVTQSAPYQVMRNPNTYQTRSDFILYLMLNLLKEGNAYAVAVRDRRGAVSTLHPLPAKSCTPYVVRETGEIFYHFSTFDVADSDFESGVMVPQRDMMHLRLFTPTHPLIGVSPLIAASMSMASHQSINAQTSAFFENMSRPDGLLTTPKPLPILAAQRLKEAWEKRAAGKTPILDNDIKYQPLTMTAVDSEIVKLFNLSVRQIANIYRIPLDFLGEMGGATFNNVEQMQKRFIMSTLGFYLEHLETAFDKFFNLPPSQAIKFDLESAMTRPDFGDRMAALSKGVTGAILTPNEAREKENLPPIDGGDEAYLQRQNWPLGMLGEDAVAPGADSATPAPASEPDTPEDKSMTVVQIKDYLRSREENCA